jgi:RimJ/RimL family protein N-acetyltransferase
MKLESTDLELVPHTLSHVSAEYVNWLNDSSIVRFSEQRFKKHTLQTCREYVESFVGSPNHLWAILEKKSGRHIGNICAIIDSNNKVAELRVLIGPADCKGKGYGRQAWEATIDFCFSSGMRKVFAGTISPNVSMLKVMQATGMKEEARWKNHYIWEEQMVDIVFYSIFKK